MINDSCSMLDADSNLLLSGNLFGRPHIMGQKLDSFYGQNYRMLVFRYKTKFFAALS